MNVKNKLRKLVNNHCDNVKARLEKANKETTDLKKPNKKPRQH